MHKKGEEKRMFNLRHMKKNFTSTNNYMYKINKNRQINKNACIYIYREIQRNGVSKRDEKQHFPRPGNCVCVENNHILLIYI